ncbi:MAG: MFS transporter [Eubacteriaceae bacterium]|nr:MFS transporter [Eubacteriaceae bacterium]
MAGFENNKLNEDYRDWKRKTTIFLCSQGISLFGSSLVAYAIIWYITLKTTSGSMMTISIIMSFLPQVLISMFAGVWADRYNRKHIIMLSDGLVAVSTLILAIFFFIGYKKLWLIFAVSAIRSIGSGIQSPAVSAILPQFVPKDKLMKVNGIKGSIQSLITLLSPAAGGVLLTMYSVEVSFFVDVITAAIAISIMTSLKAGKHIDFAAGNEFESISDLKKGFIYINNNKLIKNLLIYYVFFFLLVSPAAFLTPLMVARSFGGEIWRLTLNEILFSGGAVLGGIIISSWGGFKSHMKTIAVSCFGFGVCTVLLGFSPNFIFFLIAMGMAGIFVPIFNAVESVMIQESVEHTMQGRVFGIIEIFAVGLMPVGMLFYGPIADIIRIENILIITGLLIAALACVIFKNNKQ